MKYFLLILSLSFGFQASAQIKALEGVKLEYAEPGFYHFTLEGLNDSDSADYFAYKLRVDLTNECLSFSRLPKGYVEDLSFGYLFHFEGHEVWYLCYREGLVMGSFYEIPRE